jgi:hypothetical protein
MNIDRRSLLSMAALAAAPLPRVALAQNSVLPLRTPGIDHLDVMVPDVETTTKFYMGLLKTELHAQPYRGGLRYFVLLRPLNDKREVGYIAVGDSTGRGRYIGHFCTSVYDWRENSEAIFEAMAKEFSAGGYGEFPGTVSFGTFQDPDGIEIQFLPAPDTLVTVAEPNELVPWHQGLVTPLQLDSVYVIVSNLERALGWYSVLYGQPAQVSADSAYFEFPESQTRLHLQQSRYEYGLRPRIAEFGIKVQPFDKAAAAAKVEELGGTVLPSEEPAVLRLRDPDGNTLRLVPV